MAWGREGLAERIDRSMDLADTLWRRLNDHPKAEVYREPETGVILWRPTFPASNEEVKAALPSGSVSTTSIGDQGRLRHVAANPNADIEHVWAAISTYLDRARPNPLGNRLAQATSQTLCQIAQKAGVQGWTRLQIGSQRVQDT